ERPSDRYFGRGEEDTNGGAAAERTASLDPPAVRLDQVLHDGEPQPCPALFTRAPGIGSVEALEDAGQVLRSDPRAGVRDGNRRSSPSRCGLHRDDDAPPGRRMAHRVVEQAHEHSADGVAVARELPATRGGPGELDPAPARAAGER